MLGNKHFKYLNVTGISSLIERLCTTINKNSKTNPVDGHSKTEPVLSVSLEESLHFLMLLEGALKGSFFDKGHSSGYSRAFFPLNCFNI